MPEALRNFQPFYLSVLFHLFTLRAGCALTVIIHYTLKYLEVSDRWVKIIDLGTVIILLFFACFLSWKDEHRNSEVLIEQKRDLSSENGTLKRELEERDREISNLRDRTPSVVVSPSPPAQVILRGQGLGLPLPAIKQMTGSQLKSSVLTFVKKMRQHDAEQVKEDAEFFANRERES